MSPKKRLPIVPGSSLDGVDLSYPVSVTRQRSRLLRSFSSLALTACFFLFCLFLVDTGLAQQTALATQGDSDSQCVQCHTNVKGLIRLSWEVEKVKPKVGRSAETSGEG
jgi:hypothetical protein